MELEDIHPLFCDTSLYGMKEVATGQGRTCLRQLAVEL